MKGDSLGQLIPGMHRLPRLGGSCAPSRDANSGAEGALFLNIGLAVGRVRPIGGQGTARSTFARVFIPHSET
jgi:hypothetical protein